MRQLKIETIIQKRFDKINETLDKVRAHGNDGDIRLFRVKVKKLTAFLHLINGAQVHGKHIKLPQKVDRANRISGTIRTLQLQQSQIKKILASKQLGSPELYYRHISEQIIRQKEKFNNYIKGPQPFKKEEQKLMMLLPDHVSLNTIRQLIKAQGDHIEKLLVKVFPPDRSFHEVRQLFKSLLYISPYLEIEMSAVSPFALLSTYDDIDAFTVILGGFHDICTAINYLHTTAQSLKIDENEMATLRIVESLWLKEKETFRKKIYDELQKITVSGRSVEAPVEWPVM